MENLGDFKARQFGRKGISRTGAGILSRGLKKVKFDNFGTISGDGKYLTSRHLLQTSTATFRIQFHVYFWPEHVLLTEKQNWHKPSEFQMIAGKISSPTSPVAAKCWYSSPPPSLSCCSLCWCFQHHACPSWCSSITDYLTVFSVTRRSRSDESH